MVPEPFSCKCTYWTDAWQMDQVLSRSAGYDCFQVESIQVCATKMPIKDTSHNLSVVYSVNQCRRAYKGISKQLLHLCTVQNWRISLSWNRFFSVASTDVRGPYLLTLTVKSKISTVRVDWPTKVFFFYLYQERMSSP